MSTRSGRRRHPYRRTRHAGSVSGGLAIGQNRRRRQPAATQTTMDGDPDPGSCIDLTANDTLDDDVIDLTQSSGGGRNRSAIESPVVVISPVDVDNADSFSRRLSARQGLRASQDDSGDDVIDVEREATPESSGGATRSNSTIDVDNLSDDDSDLPAVPFSVTESSSALSSSEGSKITCPVCMDSDAQIRRSGRQLYSTTCGHIFCSSCIKQSLASQNRCPSCRKRITRKQIHPLYF